MDSDRSEPEGIVHDDGHDLEIDRDIAEYQAQKEAAAYGKAD